MQTDNSDPPTKQPSYQTALTHWVISISFYAGLVFYASIYTAWFFFASLAHAGDEMGSYDESGQYQYSGYSSGGLERSNSQDSKRSSPPQDQWCNPQKFDAPPPS